MRLQEENTESAEVILTLSGSSVNANSCNFRVFFFTNTPQSPAYTAACGQVGRWGPCQSSHKGSFRGFHCLQDRVPNPSVGDALPSPSRVPSRALSNVWAWDPGQPAETWPSSDGWFQTAKWSHMQRKVITLKYSY